MKMYFGRFHNSYIENISWFCDVESLDSVVRNLSDPHVLCKILLLARKCNISTKNLLIEMLVHSGTVAVGQEE